MRAGAINFLCKPVSEERLLSSVGEAVEADRAFRRDNADLVAGRDRLMTLTTRERQVLDRVVAGRLNKQTADELGTALKTIKVHRARVMHKMNVRSLAELARLIERMSVSPAPTPAHAGTGDQGPIGDEPLRTYGPSTHGHVACGGRR